MRRNHIDCQVMNNYYKKLGHKKPGLQMDFIFVFYFFVGEPGLEDEPDQSRRSFVLSTLLLSSPLRLFAWNYLRPPG